MEKTVIKRYSEAFKRQVVSEYEAGQSATWLRRKYGITGRDTIERWVKKYAHAGLRQGVLVLRQGYFDRFARTRFLAVTWFAYPSNHA